MGNCFTYVCGPRMIKPEELPGLVINEAPTVAPHLSYCETSDPKPRNLFRLGAFGSGKQLAAES